VTCPPAKARVDFDDLTLARKYSTLRAQYQAKGALFMFVRELARRTQGSDITVNAILPALMIKTELLRNMSILWRLPVALFGVTAEKAADSLFWLATDPGLDSVTGRYFYGRTEQAVTGPVADDAACLRLWELTLQMLGLPPNAF
jgi:NAD(P)-dependent dehydrogenase (short-subunit alcohol dehydrogenase family)